MGGTSFTFVSEVVEVVDSGSGCSFSSSSSPNGFKDAGYCLPLTDGCNALGMKGIKFLKEIPRRVHNTLYKCNT